MGFWMIQPPVDPVVEGVDGSSLFRITNLNRYGEMASGNHRELFFLFLFAWSARSLESRSVQSSHVWDSVTAVTLTPGSAALRSLRESRILC